MNLWLMLEQWKADPLLLEVFLVPPKGLRARTLTLGYGFEVPKNYSTGFLAALVTLCILQLNCLGGQLDI